MRRLRIDFRPLDPTQIGVHPCEMFINRLHGDRIIRLTRAIAIRLGDLIHYRLRRDLLIRGTRSLSFSTQPSGLAALVQEELNEGAGQPQRDEIQLLPHRVQLFLPLLVENQIVKRLVIAEVPHHVVKTRAEAPASVSGVVWEIAPAFGNVERVRKYRSEPRERRFVALTPT